MKFSIAIETKDRRLKGQQNYLGETLRNMRRAGIFDSSDLAAFAIVSGGEQEDFYDVEVGPNVEGVRHEFVHCPEAGCTRHQNAARAINVAALLNPQVDWAIKLEDDLDFVDDFMGSLARWTADVGAAPVPMFALAATFQKVSLSRYVEGETVLGPGEAFPNARRFIAEGHVMVQEQIGGWYGAQAIMWQREVAQRLGEWLGPDPFLPGDNGQQHRDRGHDLLLQAWGFELGMKYFGAAVPSFVQHIGRQSNLNRPEVNHVQPFFEFPFPGRDWRYVSAVTHA